MQAKPHLRALTGLRFVAAAWVMSLHLWQIETESRGVEHLSGGGVLRGIENAVSCGSAGVTLFFVLSGFILTYTYWDPERRGPIARRAFWWARFSRVYPVYALGLVVGFVPWLASVDFHRYTPLVTAEKVGGVFAATVLLLQSWVPRMAHRWNSVGWSLSNEAFFYLMFAFLVVPLGRLRRRGLLAVGALAYAASVAIATVGVAHHPDLAGYAYFHPLFRITDFVIGMAAGHLFVTARTRGAAPRASGLGAVAAIGIAAVVLALSPALPAVLVQNALLAPVFALAIYTLGWGRGLVARLLAARPLVVLGEASYALYILHLLALRFVFGAAATAWYVRTWWFALLTCGAIVAISVGVFRFYEEPARRRLRGRLRPAPATPPPIPQPDAETLVPSTT